MKSLAFEICSEQAQVYKRLMKEKRWRDQENIDSLAKARCEIQRMLDKKDNDFSKHAA